MLLTAVPYELVEGVRQDKKLLDSSENRRTTFHAAALQCFVLSNSFCNAVRHFILRMTLETLLSLLVTKTLKCLLSATEHVPCCTSKSSNFCDTNSLHRPNVRKRSDVTQQNPLLLLISFPFASLRLLKSPSNTGSQASALYSAANPQELQACDCCMTWHIACGDRSHTFLFNKTIQQPLCND